VARLGRAPTGAAKLLGFFVDVEAQLIIDVSGDLAA